MGPWLPAILSLSVNSPFWLGEDTGYASFRTEIWRRWPTSGTPEPFGSRADYDRLVEVLLATGSIDDPARVHWDVRPSPRYPTLEFRPRVAPRHILAPSCCAWRRGGLLGTGWTENCSTWSGSDPFLPPR